MQVLCLLNEIFSLCFPTWVMLFNDRDLSRNVCLCDCDATDDIWYETNAESKTKTYDFVFVSANESRVACGSSRGKCLWVQLPVLSLKIDQKTAGKIYSKRQKDWITFSTTIHDTRWIWCQRADNCVSVTYLSSKINTFLDRFKSCYMCLPVGLFKCLWKYVTLWTERGLKKRNNLIKIIS